MSDFTCPHSECDSKKTFATERAMKIHYKSTHGESLAKEETMCETEGCTNVFEYYPSDKSGKLCDKCTKNKNYHLTEQDVDYFRVTCANCGDEKTITESRFNTYDMYFCGTECRNEYFENKGTIECENCGNIKKVEAWMIEHGRRYCNRECYEEDNASDGLFNHNYYGKSFENVRDNVRERDNEKCQVCGKDKSDLGRIPSAHHVTPVQWFIDADEFSKDDANYEENMVLLCEHHHSLVEFDKINLEEHIDAELAEELELDDPV